MNKSLCHFPFALGRCTDLKAALNAAAGDSCSEIFCVFAHLNKLAEAAEAELLSSASLSVGSQAGQRE